MIVLGAIMPHPPILVPQIGKDRIKEAEKTRDALKELAKRIKAKEKEFDSIVIITPHGAVSQVSVPVYTSPIFEGNFSNFGSSRPTYRFKGDPALSIAIVREAGDLAQRSPETTLDHGALVPLHFISEAAINKPIVPIGISIMSLKKLYEFGKVIQKAAQRIGKKVLIIASADMSHRLTHDAPSGFDESGKVFDEKLVEMVRHLEINEIITFNEEIAERAGQDALWTISIMLGAFDGMKITSEILSYEGPFGVGYMVAEINTGPAFLRKNVEAVDPLIDLARQAINAYIREKRVIAAPRELPAEMSEMAGVFVSLKKHGQLRGCIGTFSPTSSNVAEEIINNAIESATADLRFSPVKTEELKDLEISVDVLSAPVKIESIDELDAKKFGIIVKSGSRRGLLLPDLEGVDTPEQQIKICRQKGGIGEDDPVELFKFRVRRHK